MNEYTRELGEVLRTFDVDKFRLFVLDHINMYSNDCILNHMGVLADDMCTKGTMAKMILARTDMPAELICEAKKVLDELGWNYNIY